MKCPRCQHENRPGAKFCEECAAPINGATSALSSSLEMKAEIEGLRRSLTEALDQRTATSEILGIISRSRTDAQPVFETIVRSAEKLCNGLFGALVRYDGELVHFVAQHNFPPAALDEVRRIWPTRPSRASGAGRAILDRAVVQIPDIELDPEYGLQRLSRAVGHRSSIYVPMLRDGLPIGVIIVARAEAGGFADNQVELLKTFADQAVIAIENVRLFTELQEKNQALSQAHAQVTESLEQQTATSEILRVIAGSPTDLQPVLDALVENAGRLCQAADTALLLVEGDQLRVAASHGYVEGRVIGFSNPIQRGWVAGRAVVDARTVHVEDLATAEADFPLGREIAVRFGHRTALATPLLREGAPIGALFLRRRQVRPFSDKEITLLQTFADQGVIAIENVRLFKELETRNRDLSEALERQTATADILRAISQAQTDVQPVFEALADSAMRLLGAWGAAVGRYDGELLSLAAARGGLPGSADAARERLQPPHRPSAPPEQAVLTKRVQHVVDVETDASCGSEFRRHAAARGFRSFVAVPMLRGSDPLGMIAVIRAQPGGFSTGEIALLETFADQAVIAIENVRLFNELQDKNRALTQAHAQVSEALEQQTATSEILRVISSSPTDVQPVFETIITNAVTLCDAREASVFRFDGELIHLVASNIMDESFLDSVRTVFPRAPGQGSVTARAILTRGVTHVPDIAADPEYEHTSLVQSGRRTVLSVPMMKDSHPIGAITVARRDVRSF